MNNLIKICLILFGVCYFINLNCAIGCQSLEHTVDYWNVSAPVNQECNCACRQVNTNKGYCSKCGHYGDPDRGSKTARVLAKANILLP